ncbi:hypothetical protein HU200_011879 [Digitaria exilis]|uniref:Uncharacterized protein n=1 Tax=Digitaria exilis TaxID=1010633 RepID=A0A835BGJ1_9POAL|nr:hypothetical protein HU200_039452 [Digitaria exilis]KAF8692643.1 hypothetical protein HU200_039465 [Digitaria exilis]KAF8752726.1 hypothetical protein HU200_011879 [Digitaria exilis]
MGSAFSSSNGKGCLSMRKIGSAAAFICVALLLVVAAGAATLHHHPTPIHTNNSTSLRVVPPRKILRSPEAATVEPTNVPKPRNRCASNRRSSSTSGCDDPLPRGIIHATANLEMEPSLAGDPEHRTKHQQEASATTPPKPKKSLLAVPVGIKNKAVVDKLVSKFPADDFAVMLFHYDGAVEQWADVAWSERAVHVSAKGQTKWWFAKRFLHPDVVAEYDYVFVWDEDVEVDAFDPVRYLHAVRREGLHVSQPALDRRSEIHHAITARAASPTASGVHRRVTTSTRCGGDGGAGGPPCAGWVEVMVPVFSRAAWRCAWGMLQSDLIHGWGLDYKLGYCAQGDRGVHVGVVDSEYVLHRGVPMLGDGGGKDTKSSAGRAAVRLRSFKEMQIFNRRWEKAAAEDDSWTDPYAARPATASSR